MKKIQWRNFIMIFMLTLAVLLSSLPTNLISTAYAGATEPQTEIKYVENIGIYTEKTAKEQLQGYEFDAATTEYDVTFPDTRAGLAPFIITIPDEYVTSSVSEAKLYCQISLDGSIVKKGTGRKATDLWPLYEEETKITSATALSSSKIEDAGSTLVIKVGQTDENKAFTAYNEYTYKIKKMPTLKNLEGLNVTAGDESVELTSKLSTQDNPYETNYTAVIGDSEVVTLNLKATSDNTEIYVNDEKLEKSADKSCTRSINISKEKKAEAVSIKLMGASGINTTYTLNLCRKNYAPNITSQSEKKSANKGDTSGTIFVQVAGSDEYTLEYQWYKGINKREDEKITGATESSYLPTQEFAGTETYYCKITRIVDGAKFVTWSESIEYTVNKNMLTAPTFSGKPYVLGNAGSNIYVENDSPQIALGVLEKNDQPIEGVEYQLSIYKNDTNSNEGGKLIESCTARKTGTTTSGYSEYCFDLPSQEGIGAYYYYIKVEVSEGDKSASRVSEPIKLTFKYAKDIVKQLEGRGSVEDPFILSSQKDLEYVKELVEGKNGTLYNFSGQTLVFANDIELDSTWEPIGTLKDGTTTESNGENILPFSGTIDGKNYTLTVDSKPLFNYVRRATIKNLNLFDSHIQGYGLVDKYTVDYGETGVYANDPIRLRTVDIENVTIKSGSKILKAGFIGGYASGVNTVNIRNCIVESGVIIGDDGSWGDLGDTSYGYGYISESFNHRDNIGSFTGAFNGTITNCVSYATVYGRNNVGGLVGMKGQSMGSCDILNSSFQGKIIATGEKVGGIIGAGYISGSAPGTPTVEIHNCYVNADIQGNDRIGGLIGSEEGHENFNDTGDSYGIKGANSISDSFFYGKITAADGATKVGGILGYVHDFSKKSGEATNYYLNSCGATSGIGGCVEGTMSGVDKYAASATETEFSDGTVLTKLQASTTSYQNWELKDSAKYPTTSNNPVVTSLSLEGEWKTEYVIGENLDLTGMEIFANWSDNTKTKLEIGKDITYSGYDKNTRGFQTITLQYKSVKATTGVKVLKPVTNPDAKITVYFTLYGDGIHNSDLEGATAHTLSAGNLTKWISKESYKVGVNATVWDLLQEVQKAHSSELKFNNKGNYIDYLYYDSSKSGKFDKSTLLGEFTNGKLTGWMYTLNGTHPLLGVEEQFLSNGDSVVWHYTDDYTVEEGSDKWTTDTTTETVDKVTTSGTTGSATTTTPTETKVTEKTATDGTKEKTATVTVTADNQTEIIKQATEKKSEEIVLEAAAADTKSAQTIQVELDKTFVKNVSEKTDADLTLNTENGKVTLDQETIKTVLSEAKGTTITIEVAKVEKPTEVQKTAAGTNGEVVDLTVKSGNTVIHDFGTGKVTVKLAIPSKLTGKNVAAIYIADDGKTEQMPGKILTENSKKYYEFTTSHFSTFALVDADELGLDVADELDVKAEVAKLTPVARSSKTAKKNIKVTTSLDKNDKAIIAELKDAGYTVKYRFYRSTKKASSYKAKLTGTTGKYTNTAGKKGTRYYYKVQLRVYDQTGKLVAKTALKQCKYATRIFG